MNRKATHDWWTPPKSKANLRFRVGDYVTYLSDGTYKHNRIGVVVEISPRGTEVKIRFPSLLYNSSFRQGSTYQIHAATHTIKRTQGCLQHPTEVFFSDYEAIKALTADPDPGAKQWYEYVAQGN